MASGVPEINLAPGQSEADYWRQQAERYRIERDSARDEIHRVHCSLLLAVSHIEGVKRMYYPNLRESA